jgi:hypothetical protein
VPLECREGKLGDNTAFQVLWWISSLYVLVLSSFALFFVRSFAVFYWEASGPVARLWRDKARSRL